MTRSIVSIFLLSTLCVLVGCEKYRPSPLDDVSVDRALSAPRDGDLQTLASNLANPQLRPLQNLSLHPELGLTPDEAAVIAVILNPSLRAMRDEHGISQAALLQAGLLPNPQLTYSYAWNTGGTVVGSVNPYGIGLNYDISSLISHAAKQHAAESSARSVDLNIAWQEWQTAEAAKAAVYDLISLQQQARLAKEVDDRLSENLKLVQHAADLRLKTALDSAAAESAMRDAHAVVLQIEHDLQHQRLLLNRALGVAPQTNIMLRDGLSLADHFNTPSPALLGDHIEDHRVDLLALKQGYDSQEQKLVVACLDQFPRINLGFNRDRDNTGVRSWGLGVSIDIPVFDHNQGSIAAEKATRQQLRDEFISRVFDARADIASAIADISTLNMQIKDAEAALPSLKKLVEVYRDAVDHGNVDVLSYYVAWNNLTQKNLDLLKLQQQLADNRIALELATGQYLSDEAENATTRPATVPAATLPAATGPTR
jgi:outer membrane protein TolC